MARMNARDQGFDWQASGRTPEFVVVVDFHRADGAGVETGAHLSRLRRLFRGEKAREAASFFRNIKIGKVIAGKV